MTLDIGKKEEDCLKLCSFDLSAFVSDGSFILLRD